MADMTFVERIARLEEENARLREGLACAIEAAFDGPAEPVGSNCKESHRQWRERMERTARAAYDATKGDTHGR